MKLRFILSKRVNLSLSCSVNLWRKAWIFPWLNEAPAGSDLQTQTILVEGAGTLLC